MPGMKVIQFGFSDKGAHIHLPHRYTTDTIAYTGTHDNDTTQGWWAMQAQGERGAIEAYVGAVNDRPAWPLIRAVEASVSQIAVVPAQDLLGAGLGGAHEHARGGQRQLELASSREELDAGDCSRSLRRLSR